MWKMDSKSISALPEYPIIQISGENAKASEPNLEWQSPVCKITVGNDVQIMVNVLDGSLIAFPMDVINSKKENGKTVFHSDKLPLSGEILIGEYLRVFMNGDLFKEFEIK
jgi:hypothetical protein